jgi:uncharacterized FlgJ-related protein
MKEFKRDIALILIIFIIGLATGIAFTELLNSRKIDALKKQVEKTTCLEEKIDINCFRDNLEKHKIKFSHIVLAQAILESSNFKSQLFRSNKNALGMRVAAQRFTFAINSHDYGAYAKYESVENCILDYKAFQIQNALFITTDAEYFKLLESIYAEDQIYISKLKQIIKKNKS